MKREAMITRRKETEIDHQENLNTNKRMKIKIKRKK